MSSSPPGSVRMTWAGFARAVAAGGSATVVCVERKRPTATARQRGARARRPTGARSRRVEQGRSPPDDDPPLPRPRCSGPLGWTAADEAELQVLIAELVLLVPEHRTRCGACERERQEGWPCPAVTAAIELVLTWHWRRTLLSRAEHLRRIEEAA